jgi:hypothetical protein
VILLPIQDDFEPDQPNARYITLVPLYNSGVPSDRIELYASGLNKMMWGLSAEDDPPLLSPVQLDGLRLDDGSVVEIADNLGDKLLFRVDEREFLWDNEGEQFDVWEELMKAYPYGIRYDDQFDAAEDLVALTKTRIPIVHGDWMALNARVFPLYDDVLNIPNTISEFYVQFGGPPDLDTEIAENRAECVGMDSQQTLVSNFNRVFCRHDTTFGYAYESYDFGGQVGDQNIFAAPDVFNLNEDGGEAFISLPNGMVAWIVYAAAGNKLAKAPANIVADFRVPNGDVEVEAAADCEGCHTACVIERQDQILDTVLGNESAFDDAVVDKVQELFLPNTEWDEIYARDIADCQNILEDLGVDVSGEEPTFALYLEHDVAASPARVAAELGIPAALLEGAISTNAALEVAYSSLFNGAQVLDRESFDNIARDTICDLELGDVCDEANFCGLSSVPCVNGSVCDVATGQCTKVDVQ